MNCIAVRANSLKPKPDRDEFRKDGGFQCIDGCRMTYKFYAPKKLTLDRSEFYRNKAKQILRREHPKHPDEIIVDIAS